MVQHSSKFKVWKSLALTLVCLASLGSGIARASILPDPLADTPLASTNTPQTITFAGGCFWGVQAVFEHTKGVMKAVSGYAGGNADTANYEMVSTGTTGHAESVQVTYDPSEVTLGQLLKVYFSVAHDPTELNKQGPDHGTQYRSEIFYSSPEQEKIASAYVAQLARSKSFSDPIVTKIQPLQGFYPAESYHQDYARLHPDNGYIAANDLPKVAALKKEYPQLYVEPK